MTYKNYDHLIYDENGKRVPLYQLLDGLCKEHDLRRYKFVDLFFKSDISYGVLLRDTSVTLRKLIKIADYFNIDVTELILSNYKIQDVEEMRHVREQ